MPLNLFSYSLCKGFTRRFLSSIIRIENEEDKMVRENDQRRSFKHIGENRTLLNNILNKKTNWIGHILRKNCLLHDAIEGQMTEVEEVGRRIAYLLDDLRKRKILGAKGGS